MLDILFTYQILTFVSTTCTGRQMGDWKEAADSHFKAGEHMHAITIMGDRAWVEQLIDSIRQLPKCD